MRSLVTMLSFYFASLLINSYAIADTQTCTPCVNGQQYCGTISDESGEWLSGDYKECKVVLSPRPIPIPPPPAVAQGCTECIYGEAFCGYYQIQTGAWLSGAFFGCWEPFYHSCYRDYRWHDRCHW